MRAFLAARNSQRAIARPTQWTMRRRPSSCKNQFSMQAHDLQGRWPVKDALAGVSHAVQGVLGEQLYQARQLLGSSRLLQELLQLQHTLSEAQPWCLLDLWLYYIQYMIYIMMIVLLLCCCRNSLSCSTPPRLSAHCVIPCSLTMQWLCCCKSSEQVWLNAAQLLEPSGGAPKQTRQLAASSCQGNHYAESAHMQLYISQGRSSADLTHEPDLVLVGWGVRHQLSMQLLDLQHMQESGPLSLVQVQ